MFWVFKLSFDLVILAFFYLKTVWATFGKIGQFFFQIFWSPWNRIKSAEVAKCGQYLDAYGGQSLS